MDRPFAQRVDASPEGEADRPGRTGAPRRRLVVRVDGVVQGVGFRPHVHRLATELALTGVVGNDAHGVTIEVEGPGDVIAAFVERLPVGLPPQAGIDHLTTEEVRPLGSTSFIIGDSTGVGGDRDALIPPDLAPCPACLAELADPADRRHRHPFITCTACGPRFTVVTDVPYDRTRTTMAGFALCDACSGEYRSTHDRRFHAETICCPGCGPTLRLVIGDVETATGPAAVTAAAGLLGEGVVLAVKGIGGYHLAAAAGDDRAVAALRARKHREDKPFALLVRDVEAAGALCELDDAAVAALTSSAAPIVLLPRRPGAAVAPTVAPGSRWLGVMLPPSPLHHLLAEAVGGPLVLTSGNVSDEPIAFDDGDARHRLASIADGFLVHDRPIHVRADDSVVRIVAGRTLPVRRSRGYAPQPIRLPWTFVRPVLAVGAELKSTFCLGKGDRAFVSHHIGDLGDFQSLRAFETSIEHYQRLFGIRPQVVAHDLHPGYRSTSYALDLDGVDLVAVQHHHAHIASCLADNGEAGPVIGVAFDGLGLGADGTLWGGEVLVADLREAYRVAHLEPVPQPGGDRAAHEPWRMAGAHLVAAYGDAPLPDLGLADRHPEAWDAVVQLARTAFSSPPTSSMGRLFDAVAALLGLRDVVSYEGQAAVELEQQADPSDTSAYVVSLSDGDPIRIHGADLILAVAEDHLAGVPSPTIAARFHNGIADVVVAVCAEVRRRTALTTVALSGGVFQNALLLQRLVPQLRRAGFGVLTHRLVPPNDGGISLGQAVVAAARLRDGQG